MAKKKAQSPKVPMPYKKKIEELEAQVNSLMVILYCLVDQYCEGEAIMPHFCLDAVEKESGLDMRDSEDGIYYVVKTTKPESK